MSRARLASFRVRLFDLALLIVLLTSTAGAQGVPWYTIPLPIPNGFVDVATGNLHLEIPLASVPERNGDSLRSKVVYDSSSWGYNGGWGLQGPGWQVFTGNSHSGQAGWSTTSTSCAQYSPYTQGSVNFNYFTFTDFHSTTHSLSGPNNFTRQLNCTDPATGLQYGTRDDIVSASGTAGDGSGYTFNVQNYTSTRVTAPDGTIVWGGFQTGPAPVDTNGNYSGYGLASSPDMLGRSPFQFSPSVFSYLCPSSGTIGVRASDGSTNNYIFACSSLSVSEILFGTQYTAVESFLTSIGLPDGTQYSFAYDTGTTGNHPGSLLSVTLPDGGAISFTYPTGSRTVTFVGNTWTLSYAANTPSTGQTTITVMSPLRYDSASKTNVSDKSVFVTAGSSLPYIQTVQYYSGSSSLLRTVSTSYSTDGLYLPQTITTTLSDSGQSSSVSYQYYNNQLRDYPTQKQETDFTGAVVRTTKITYNGNFMKPTSINLYAGSNTTGTPVSSTLYTYDEYSANYCKNGVAMLTNITGATSHDDTDFGVSFTARGNVTTTQRLISGTSYAISHACYDTLGNVTQTVDANGNPTTYDYSDSGKWADSYCVASGTVTHAFPATVTDALGHQTKHSYFTCTTLKQSDADQNEINASKSTTYAYDMFGRPVTISYPDGGHTTYCYSHDPSFPCYTTSLPPFSTMSQLMTSNTSLTSKTLLDGYGRVAESAITSDPNCSSGDKTDYVYDAFGRTFSVSNPYCTTGDPTYGLTTYSYDALGRSTQVTHPDGASAITSYSGSAAEVTDEGNGTQSAQRISQSDALGRITSVCEVAPGPFVGPGGTSSSSLIGSSGSPAACGLNIAGTGFLTTYQYDPLDNLLQVNQNGIGARTFSYDSRSSLVCASNPENSSVPCPTTAPSSYIPGTIGYTYDPRGNLLTKTSPAPDQTGTASVTLSYCYDALNRMVTKAYTLQSCPMASPVMSYTYDAPVNGLPITNAVGRITQASAGTAITVNSYDLVGRIKNQWQCTPQNCGTTFFNLAYNYDYMGNIISSANGMGVTLTYGYNGAAELTSLASSLSDANHPNPLLTVNSHTPFGQPSSDSPGNGMIEKREFDNRLRPISLTAAAPEGSGVSSTGTITITGRDQLLLAKDYYDNGTLYVNVNGFQVSTPYGNLFPGGLSTPSSLATAITAAINSGPNFPVTATASGAVVTLTSVQTGSGTNYSLAAWFTANIFFSGKTTPGFSAYLSGTTLTGGSNVLYTTNIGYAPNGDVLYSYDTANGNWRYSYDAFNRLTGATQSRELNGNPHNPATNPYNYVYDRFGNRWQQNGSHSMQLTFTGNNPASPQNNNRIDGYTYDSAGNLYYDGVHTYFYDPENRLIQVDGTLGACSSATACYVYDANDRRIRKTTFGASVDYLYDLSGTQVAEVSSAGTWNRGEVYAAGHHIATYVGGTSGTTYFNNVDWLGTERVRSTVAGVSCENISSLPFGDNLATNGACGDPSPMHFTGKERDSESGLDNFGARYDSSSMGRFLRSDDPNEDQDPADPQSWNLYSYVRNNPLNNTDPTGNACVSSDGGKTFHDDDSGGQSCKEAQEPQKVEVREKAPPPTLPHVPMDTLTMLMCHNCPSPPFDKNQQALGAPVGPIGPIGSLVTETAEELTVMARLSAILREAAAGKGNFGVGAATAAEAAEAGEAWVGQGAKVAGDGKALVSADGLRQYRPPSLKPNLGKVQANFESRQVPSGQWQSNAHLDIK
jgi:RHS repeat-associated protein